MKKLILIIGLVLVLTMSAFALYGVYDLTGYNDYTEELSTLFWNTSNVSGLCTWMQANFTWNYHTAAYSPVQQFINKDGDCNDMSTFVLYFWARKFGSSGVKQVYIRWNENAAHMIAVGSSGTWYSDNQYYHSGLSSIAACVAACDDSRPNRNVDWYNVYDYDLNLIQSSKSPAGVPDIPPSSLE